MRHNLRLEQQKETLTNVQSMKIRRLEQGLFLSEMERLADAMCKHYIDARTNIPPVASDDIRSHVEAIQGRVHSVLLKEADRASAAVTKGMNANLLAELKGARSIRVDDIESSRGSATNWTAQSGRGVAARLRRQPGRPPVSMLPNDALSDFNSRNTPRPLVTARSIDDAQLLVVNRFEDLDNPKTAALLDINMDGNSHPLSARRPQKRPTWNDPVAIGSARLKAAIPTSLPQLAPYPMERIKTPPQDKKVPLPWSPRDPLQNTASAVVSLRVQREKERSSGPCPHPPSVGSNLPKRASRQQMKTESM